MKSKRDTISFYHKYLIDYGFTINSKTNRAFLFYAKEILERGLFKEYIKKAMEYWKTRTPKEKPLISKRKYKNLYLNHNHREIYNEIKSYYEKYPIVERFTLFYAILYVYFLENILKKYEF